MSDYLVTLSLGPVQSLISAARRTRDLWCGSWLLSEASRAAARTLDEAHPGCLIFPALTGEHLAPQNGPAEGANVSNVLRAEIQQSDSAAIRALCDEAKSAAAVRLRELGEKARQKATVRDDVWRTQIDDILECYAAWVAVTDDNYRAASAKLGAILAARKATRNFRQCGPFSASGLPKSSLDGALETVLPDRLSDTARRRLGLSKNEQLDALGAMKRLAGEVEQFTPYSRIAADPWIEDLNETQRQRLCKAYEPLVPDRATRVRGNGGTYNALPFDAQMLYSSRLESERAETDGREDVAVAAFEKCVREVRRQGGIGEPVPYAAILKADGDRMGEFLSQATSASESRRMSKALHEFASQVRKVVQRHRGHAVYAGGDDVLALLPLAGALDCAKELAEEFARRMRHATGDLGGEADALPTLSVGLGIGHFMEPLGALRARAERAEKRAKGDDADCPRNALAIVLGVRSGDEHCWRVNWSDDAAREDLARAAEAFRDRALPSRIVYDLRGIDLRLAWLRQDSSSTAEGMRRAELRRLLDRARVPGANRGICDELQALLERRVDAEGLDKTAEMLIIARWLAARTAADVGER